MPKFILTIDAGFGEEHKVVEAEDIELARAEASEWLQGELDANYWSKAETFTKELAEEYDLDDEDEEEDE